MNGKKPQNQVSLAGVAKVNVSQEPPKKKRSFLWVIPVAVVMAMVIAVVAVVGVVFGGEDGPSLSAQEMVEYTVTPDSISGKVSYFALGVTGAKPEDRMDMVAVMWCDWKKQTAGILQVPVATYIGTDTNFAVSAVGDVWANPQPETFCSSCRIRLQAEDIAEGTHKTCGAATELRTGSAYGDLIRVFNDQYGLPIDNFLVISRAGLVEFIDRLGGVDVKLEKDMKLNDVNYKKGVQLLDGAAAVDYAVTDGYKGTPDGDLTRMARQRQVLTAVLQRLGRCSYDELYSTDPVTGAVQGVIGKQMLGENPIRFNSTSFGKARLLNVSESAADDMKLSVAMAKFMEKLGDLSLDKVSVSVLPGVSAKHGTSTLYSVDAAKALELLNGQMNPYGLTLDATTVKIPVLKEKANGKVTTVTLDTLAVEQSAVSDDSQGEE